MSNLSHIRRQFSKSFTGPIAKVAVRTGISPDFLTVTGFIISAIAAGVIAFDYKLAGGLLVLVAGLFDLMDGAVARAAHKDTVYGALLDSTFARISEAAVLLGALWLYRGDTGAVLLIFIVLTGSLMVSYVKARAEGLGLECNSGWFTRPERVIILALGLIVGQVVVALYILAVFTWITVCQRLYHVFKNTRSRPS